MFGRTTNRHGRQAYPWERRRRRILIFFVAIPLLLLGAFAGWRVYLQRGVAQRLEVIRAQGFPASLEELEAWYPPIPEEENAWKWYRQAFDAWSNPSPEQLEPLLPRNLEPPKRTEAFPDEALAAMRGYAAMNAETLELLHRAAAMPHCRYPIDLSEGQAIDLPHLSAIDKIELLLRFEVEIALDAGDTGRVLRALSDIVVLGCSLRDEPVPRSQWKRMGLNATACSSLERVLSRTALPAEAALALGGVLASAESPEAGLRAALGEFCAGIPRFSIPVADRVNYRLLFTKFRRVADEFVPCVLDAAGGGCVDLQYYLDAHFPILQAARLPRPEGLSAERSCGPMLESIPYRWAPRSYALRWQVGGTINLIARDEAQLRTARTALAVERYRLAYGGLPGMLDALIPEFLDVVPADPYNGEPLRYHILDAGYVVYSVSSNLSDEGGDERENNAGELYSSDAIFKVERL